MDELRQQLVDLSAVTQKALIGDKIDPTVYTYLQQYVNGMVASILATRPTQTYSVSAPSGSAVTGSTWYEDTGVLATRKIYVYSGAAWVQMK